MEDNVLKPSQFILHFTIILLVACTAAPKEMKQLWNPRIGNYSYDQAVSENGVPATKATLDNGKTEATWTREVTTKRVASGRRGSRGRNRGVRQVDFSHTENLTLRFDANGMLESWNWEERMP